MMNLRFHSHWSAAAALFLSLAAAGPRAMAQGAGNVNECTLIQDPTELRNCILRFEGQRTPLPTTLESGTEANGQPIPAGDGSSSVPIASPPPLTRAEKRRPLKLAAPQFKKVTPNIGAMPSQQVSRRPKTANSVWVEQIKIPKRR